MQRGRMPNDTHPDVRAIMLYLFNLIFNPNLKTSSPPPVTPSNDPTYFGSGSPNMKLLYSLVLWAYQPNKINTDRLISRLTLETQAHGNIEPLSTSHCQLWLGIMASGLLISQSKTKSNPQIQSLTLDWLKIEFSIYSICEHPSVGPWTPGGRGFIKTGKGNKVPSGSNTSRPLFMEAVRTGKIKKGKPNQYDLGPWCITLLPDSIRHEIMIPPSNYPPIWGGFHARRFSDGSFYSYFDDLSSVMEPVKSAGFDGVNLWTNPPKTNEFEGRNYGDVVMSIDMDASKLALVGQDKKDNDDEE